MCHEVGQPHTRLNGFTKPAANMPDEKEKCQKQSQLSVLFLTLADVCVCVLEMRETAFFACWRIWLRRRDSRMEIPSRCVFIARAAKSAAFTRAASQKISLKNGVGVVRVVHHAQPA